MDRERKRERREKEIYKERQGGNRWWACERDREGERGDREREMEERNRKGERERERGRPKDTPTYIDRDKLLTMNES